MLCGVSSKWEELFDPLWLVFPEAIFSPQSGFIMCRTLSCWLSCDHPKASGAWMLRLGQGVVTFMSIPNSEWETGNWRT